jgi:hypothetical protein
VLVPIAAPPESQEEARLLFCEISGLKASGHLTPNGIVVLAQSQAAQALRPSAKDYPWVINAREQLLKDGVLAPAAGHLVFTKNHEFSSPSAAAAVIHGGTANGRTAWKDASGQTLKQLESV